MSPDYQGTYNMITDTAGNVSERLSFDPWGKRRNPETWDYTDIPTSFIFDRGYTGHEHLDKFRLINMNGRLYDPSLARFLSPDPVIQDISNLQAYNSYGYCLNNPSKYSDPSGYYWNLTTGKPLGDPFLGYSLNSDLNSGAPDYAAFQGACLLAFAAYVAYWHEKTFGDEEESTEATYTSKETIGMLLSLYFNYPVIDISTPGSPQPVNVMLQNEIDGFNRLWYSSSSEKTEYAALITSSGLITFKIAEDGGDLFGGLKPIWRGEKCYVNFGGTEYQVLGSVHVHWNKTLDAGLSYYDSRDGSGDKSAAYYTLKGQIPLFVLGWDKNIYFVSYKYPESFQNYLNNYNVSYLLNGKLSLMKLLMLNP